MAERTRKGGTAGQSRDVVHEALTELRRCASHQMRNPMSSNVHALELGRVAKGVDVSRPDRADVELAFRTIIRWAGDDPERPGLIETPARAARAFEEFSPVPSIPS